MRILFLLSCFLLFSLSIFAQKLTDQKLAEIMEIADLKALKYEALQYKAYLDGGYMNKEQIEFSVDTFRIHRISELCMEANYTTAGMNEALMHMADGYDKLLNKYYQKLLKVLEEEDKKVLIEAERAWIKFRDAEKVLIGTLSKEQYSGDGTLQLNIATEAYADLTIKRTIDIFNHYDVVVK